MNSDKIKAIVISSRALMRGEGGRMELMELIGRDMRRSPRLAGAIIQHLRDQGVDLLSGQHESEMAFRDAFEPHVEQIKQLAPRELDTIRKIVSKAFQND